MEPLPRSGVSEHQPEYAAAASADAEICNDPIPPLTAGCSALTAPDVRLGVHQLLILPGFRLFDTYATARHHQLRDPRAAAAIRSTHATSSTSGLVVDPQTSGGLRSNWFLGWRGTMRRPRDCSALVRGLLDTQADAQACRLFTVDMSTRTLDTGRREPMNTETQPLGSGAFRVSSSETQESSGHAVCLKVAMPRGVADRLYCVVVKE
jgi:hypothetical protein